MSLISVKDHITGLYTMVESNDSAIGHAADIITGEYLGLVPLTTSNVQTTGKPPKVGNWVWLNNGWQEVPLTLDELKNIKWKEIKATREVLIDAPIDTPFGIFDSNAEARANVAYTVLLAQARSAAGLIVDITFTKADNTTIALDLMGITTVGLLLGIKVQEVRNIATALRIQIYNAVDETQLAAISWPV